ncbi:MAG: DUF4230 domain-containing protein [Saprospiraceae bacterium]|nr:DUF4230 domain-containing protein [Saprospiraceae bacterium]
MRNIGLILLVVGTFALGFLINSYFFKGHVSTENSQVMLEKIKNVCKVINVEGYFTEVYDYKDYWGYNISFFQKKALVRIKAKVSMGYDMNKIIFKSNPMTKTISISKLPEPEILSIDHDLDYYDITEGSFNSFTTEDYNKINANAKDFIKKKVETSGLKDAAMKEGDKMLEVIRFMVESMGWKLDTTTNLKG